MNPQSISPAATLPPDRRGRLQNGAAPGDFLAAPRCGARTRSGGCCRQPAMRNGRCRMHGGLSTGPRTATGRARCAAARRTHGFYAAETIALRREANARIRRLRLLTAAVRRERTAGHGVLPANLHGGMVGATPRGRPAADGRSHRSAQTPAAAGHGVLPSFSAPASMSTRPVHRPAPRRGFVQRTLLGGTALGLGLTVPPLVPAGHPPFSAGHGVLPSFSRRAG